MISPGSNPDAQGQKPKPPSNPPERQEMLVREEPLTLRERAAIAAMQGLLAGRAVTWVQRDGKAFDQLMDEVTDAAVACADRLAKKLAKGRV